MGEVPSTQNGTRSTQYPVPSTQYPVRRAERALDARNPEGASAEAFALSGFPLLPKLQNPEGSGLPVRARYRLSVVPALKVSCLTASPSNVDPPHPTPQAQHLNRFRDHQPKFRDPNQKHPAPNTKHKAPRTQHPAPSTQYPVPSTQYPVRRAERALDARNPEGASAEASTLSGLSNQNQLAPAPVTAARRLRNSDPDRSPYRRTALRQTEVWFQGLTLTEPKPGQSARPFRTGNLPVTEENLT